MADELKWQSQQETLILQGELDRATLLPLWQQREALLADKTRIDVSQLQRVDSSGLALLVHFRELRGKQGVSLAITGVSDRLSTLIELYNLREVIPVETVISVKTASI
ncbi:MULTISPECIES: lipid asymmetry maintenance protein MlaB [Yersinia]|uniref:STAS domain protein n=1 Tax=Yersinia rochesterensis TaxID=1604335 RepID=A0ABN4FEM9_9GAMM|nr:MULTISPECIES: lipid asymmetry maintenance protein MlaB [Yersinia]AJI87456.1 putative phospholipid ABC transporter-binding protein mlaB [Yersinia frederiksenii Y225]CNH75175.1 putative anti-sigma B factor antagonist [Yersinia kristensenii]AIN19777.1 STAS domain protein [Yersinia rochesterensis]AJJ35680.1 STAS domain protein [Yersinia rochesterensis]MDA5545014.1 lipid asymmetry maintenance protein MlaB [Yersinia rochesterensis]